MAKIEGQLLDSNAVKIFKKKKHADIGLNKCYQKYFNLDPPQDISTIHTYTKQLIHITVLLLFCQKILMQGNFSY